MTAFCIDEKRNGRHTTQFLSMLVYATNNSGTGLVLS